ncbi:hypothetical protein D3C86_1671560 [compost metagenome]
MAFVGGGARQQHMAVLQLVQQVRAIQLGQQCLAQRRVQLLEDAGAQQEAAQGRRLAGKHVLRQIVGDGLVAAREAFDEGGGRRLPRE